MFPPLLRLASCRNLVRNSFNLHFISVSSVAQLTCSDLSDSSSDEYNTNSFYRPFDKLDKFEVIETLHKLNREPNIALSFITQLKESGFKHDVATYMAIVRFLCQWGMYTRLYTLFRDVIDNNNGELSFEISDLCDALIEEIEIEGLGKLIKAIDVLVKVYASVGRFEDAIDTLYRIKRGRILLPTRTCNYLMNQLIEWGKLDMVESVYRQLKMKGLIPNVYTYGIRIKGLCRKGCSDEALDVFRQMEEAGVEANAFTFGTYIDGLCSNGKTDTAIEFLKFITDSNQPVNVFAYTSIIRGFVKESKLQDAESVFLDMSYTKIVPNADCYCVLIQGYCQKGDIHRACDLYKEMESRGIKTNCVILSSIMQCLCVKGMLVDAVEFFLDIMKSGDCFLDEVSFNIVIDALCKLGKMDQAMVLFNDMKGKNMKPDVVHYTTLINGYMLNLEPWNASEIFEEMKANGLRPDSITFDVLAGGLSKFGSYKSTTDILHDMQKQGLEPTSITHNVVIEGLCKGKKTEEAIDYFNSLQVKNLDNYAAMVNGYLEANKTTDAFKLLFSEERLFAKRALCLKLLRLLCAEGEIKKAMKIYHKFEKLDNGPCKRMYSEIIYWLCIEDMQMATRVFGKMIQKGFIPDVVTYTMMLNGYCRVNWLNKARNLFLEMKNREIKPDIYTYTVLLHGARTKEDVKVLTDEFEKTDLSYDVNLYTVLIDKHCRLNNLYEAVSLFKEMEERGVERDTVTYNVLIRGLCYHGYKDEGLELYHEMQSKGIEPNKTTMIALNVEAKKV